MSTNLHRVIENFYWRINGLTPTDQYKRTKFRPYNPLNEDVPENTGGLRQYYVEWMGSDEDTGATDMDNREAWHTIRVYVEYPAVLRFRELESMILQDRQDLIKELRDIANRDGYSDDFSSTNIGLIRRLRFGDELDKSNESIWRLATEWRCFIRESEQ
jgi:hypothetical protein